MRAVRASFHQLSRDGLRVPLGEIVRIVPRITPATRHAATECRAYVQRFFDARKATAIIAAAENYARTEPKKA